MVQTVLGIFISVLLLIVVAWIAIFGGIGSLLSHSRGGSASAGVAWGTVLGPVGWLVILWTTRGGATGLNEEAVPASYAPLSTPRAPVPKRWDPWNKS